MPLANSFLAATQLHLPEPTYPLDMAFCPSCALVQITETVSPDQLFGNYLYFSSFSETMLQHAEHLTQRLISERALSKSSFVIEIGSNDGYLLRNYVSAGIPVLGIEPAKNVAAVARGRGINTICEFFGKSLASKLVSKGLKADVFHAHNVLAHVADLNGVVEGISVILKADGVAIIEVPYVRDMIDNVEFDTIYHEHLCYFSLTSLGRLFARHGMCIENVDRVEIHGGSLRAYVVKGKRRSASVDKLLDEELRVGIDTPAYYFDFTEKVERARDSLRDLLATLKSQGKKIAAYGASAKGGTLLNFIGIGSETLDFIVDRSTVKQGRYTPGTRLRIDRPEELLAKQPDYVLLLTWNFADEILGQQAEYRRRGGRFIIPIPELKIV